MTSRARFWLGFLSFVFVVVIYFGVSGMTLTDVKHLFEARNVILQDGETIRIPYPEDSDGRVLPEVPVTTSGEYSFMFEDAEGVPVRWDPCQPIHFVINPEGEIAGGEALVLEAIDSISAPSGLAFEFEGYTSEVGGISDRPLIQKDRYGDGIVPIIIEWSNATDLPILTGDVAGMGGPSMLEGAFGSQQYLVAGVIVLDSEGLLSIMTSGGGPGLVRAVIMHELGHVIGLDHVEDPGELMNPINESLLDWGPGDLAGLAIAGSGPCQTV